MLHGYLLYLDKKHCLSAKSTFFFSLFKGDIWKLDLKPMDRIGSPWYQESLLPLDEQMPTLVGQQRKKIRGPWGAGDRFDQQRSSRTFVGLEETFLEPRVAGSWIRFDFFTIPKKYQWNRHWNFGWIWILHLTKGSYISKGPNLQTLIFCFISRDF